LETGSEYESHVDIGRQLAVLHCILRDCLNVSEVNVISLLVDLLYTEFPVYDVKCCVTLEAVK